MDKSLRLQDFLERSAADKPDKVAIIYDEERITYRQLNATANGLAHHLFNNGIRKSDRIGILLENSIDYVVAYYAVLKAGAVAIPLNPGLKPDGLRFLLNDIEPAALISSFKSERLLKAVDLQAAGLKLLIIKTPRQRWDNSAFSVTGFEEGARREDNPPDIEPAIEPVTDIANIIYTSGSTGNPKGVMLSHANLVSNTKSICKYLNIASSDIQMVVLPFFYVMGKSLLNTHIAAGGTLVLNNRFMYPADVVNQMMAEKVTAFSGVPSTYAYLLNRSPLAQCRDKMPHLRYCSQAGGHMATSLKKELRAALPAHTQIYVMYGATEASARLTYLEPDAFQSKMGSIGKPIPDVDIRILNEDGVELPDGEEGELVAFGPNIMTGYWKDPQETDRALRNNGYHTGDIGYRDKEGYFFVSSRKDGLIKVGGHRINPTEIEDFLMATELLIECVVIGLPDKLLGYKLNALVVPKGDGLDASSLMRRCAAGLPNHKCPSHILIAKMLPKHANGKIDREKCIQMTLPA